MPALMDNRVMDNSLQQHHPTISRAATVTTKPPTHSLLQRLLLLHRPSMDSNSHMVLQVSRGTITVSKGTGKVTVSPLMPPAMASNTHSPQTTVRHPRPRAAMARVLHRVGTVSRAPAAATASHPAPVTHRGVVPAVVDMIKVVMVVHSPAVMAVAHKVSVTVDQPALGVVVVAAAGTGATVGVVVAQTTVAVLAEVVEEMVATGVVAVVETMAEAVGVVSTNLVVVTVVVLARLSVVAAVAALGVVATWKSSRTPSLSRAWEMMCQKRAWCSTSAALVSSRRTRGQENPSCGSIKTRTPVSLRARPP